MMYTYHKKSNKYIVPYHIHIRKKNLAETGLQYFYTNSSLLRNEVMEEYFIHWMQSIQIGSYYERHYQLMLSPRPFIKLFSSIINVILFDCTC